MRSIVGQLSEAGRLGGNAPAIRAVLAAGSTLALGWLLLHLFADSEMEIFSAGAAHLTGMITGQPSFRVEQGWLLPGVGGTDVVVSPACSASQYFLMISALISAHFARQGRAWAFSVAIGFIIGFPLTLLINTLRIVSIIQVYHWIVPHVLARRVPFIHTLTGVAVFLPCLIATNFLLEKYGYIFRAQPQQASR